MDGPLAPVDAFEQSDQQPTAEPQPLPKELRDEVRRVLSLFQRAGNRGHLAGALWFWALGICAHGAFRDVRAKSAANVWVIIPGINGVIAFALAHRVAAVVVPHVLSQLNGVRVSAKGTAALSKTVKGMKALVGYLALLSGCLSVVLAIESNPDAPHEWVAAALIVPLIPPMLIILIGLVLADVIYLLAADAAYQIAADVQRGTAVTTDYDNLATRVHRVHMDTVVISSKLTPVILGLASSMF